ncbi:hypothetical protein BDW59DRAFT_177688 [Aspergillus cavernicola]|uniref:Rhodopsin domain-containing protein n=1 Tax=Aspergillus cavernicola TaxID=176166 RepID=A0ABR4HIL6_9EURO
MFESSQPTVYGVSFVFYTLASITTGLRVYSRKWIIKSFGADDWWMTSVFVYNTAQQALFCMFLHYGGGLYVQHPPSMDDDANQGPFGRHYGVVDEKDLAMLPTLLFAEEILYIWMQFALKTGFLLFYLRLANKTSFIYSVYATMVLNVLITIALWLLYCLQCRPLPAFWNPAAYPDAKCLKMAITYYVPVSLNILTDFIILALPIRPLWNMQASLSRRIGVIAVVSVGGVAIIVSCLRIIVLHEFAVNPDFSYTLGKMVVISAVELNVAIMAANAPSLKAFWMKHVSGSLSSYMSSTPLSTLSRKQQAAALEPSVIRHRSLPKHDRDFPDSSSMNNLVEPYLSEALGNE